MAMDLNIDLNELDFNSIGSWPMPVKIFMLVFVFVFTLFLGYQFDVSGRINELNSLQSTELTLQKDFEDKQQKAVNLDAYRKQMVEMKESFGELLRQLPAKTEVPGLVEDISHQGLASGLTFKSIRLQPEKQIEFYVELPIEITAQGTYQQFANFISAIAILPRIVTMHDFKVVSIPNAQDESLEITLLVKTYRYSDDSTEANGANPGSPNNLPATPSMPAQPLPGGGG